MKYKSIAAVAVLAMFLVSSVCVPFVANDGNGETVINDTTPLKIDSTGVTSGNPDDFNATYDINTSTLTFNGDVTVNVTCDNNSPYMIDVKLDVFNIVVNGNVTLQSTSETVGDCGAICVTKVSSSTLRNTGILTIKCADDSSKLNLFPPKSTTKGLTVNTIIADFVNIVDCKMTIDNSACITSCARGICAATITIINTDLEIIGNGMNNDWFANVGLYSSWSITIQYCTVKMTKVIGGIWQEDSYRTHERKGKCSISESTVTINGFDSSDDNARSIPIYTESLTVYYSDVTAIAGNTMGKKANSVAVATDTFESIYSKLELVGQKGNSSSGLEFDSSATVRNTYLKAESAHGTGAAGSALSQSAIKSSIKGVLTAYDSTIESTNKNTTDPYSYGIITNCKFVNSSVYSQGNKAFYPDCVVSFDTESLSSLKGSNDGVNYVNITNEQVYDYKYVNSVKGLTATFNLNGGTGEAVDPITNIEPGNEITLPNCTAKKGDKNFVGWSDGRNLYEAGSNYLITVDTEFYAVYDDEKYIVSFNLDGGIGTEINPISNVVTGTKITLPLCDAKKDGLIFAGWSDGEKTYQPGDKYTVKGNVTFYAVYADEEIVVTFDLNEGKGTEISPISGLSKGSVIELPKCDAKKGNQVFVGWNDGKKIYKPGEKYVVDGNTTLYAMYETPASDSNNTGIIIAVIVIVVIAILAVVGFVWYKKS